MPLLDSIRKFISSPQGKKLTDQGKRMASDPRNQERAKGMLAKLRRR